MATVSRSRRKFVRQLAQKGMPRTQLSNAPARTHRGWRARSNVRMDLGSDGFGRPGTA